MKMSIVIEREERLRRIRQNHDDRPVGIAIAEAMLSCKVENRF